jgi:hypothetical protein
VGAEKIAEKLPLERTLCELYTIIVENLRGSRKFPGSRNLSDSDIARAKAPSR